MKRIPFILALALATSACGPEPGSKSSRTTGDTAGSNNDGNTNAGSVVAVDEGLYIGSPADEPGVKVTLSVWSTEDSSTGNIVVDGVDAYRLDFGDSPQLSALDGACFDCPTNVWDVELRQTADGLRIAVLTDDAGPGFRGVDMVPHDGFKPENAPAPGGVDWVGGVVAVAPEVTSHPVLDSNCGIYIDAEQLVSMWCESATAQSPWVAAVASSWTAEGDRRTWIVESDGRRHGFIGTVARSGEVVQLRGTIVRLDEDELPEASDDVVGTFRLTD